MSTFFIFKFFSVETIIIVGVHYLLILADEVSINQHMHVILSEDLNSWKNKARLVWQKWNYNEICVEHLETTCSVDIHSPHEMFVMTWERRENNAAEERSCNYTFSWRLSTHLLKTNVWFCFFACIPHQILFGWWNQGRRDAQGMWHIWGGWGAWWEFVTGFCWRNLMERDLLQR